MQVLWTSAPLTTGEIVEALQRQEPGWHPKTAQTLIGRLVKKKAIGFTAQGRTYLYRPLVSQEACIDHETETFLDRLFGGSLKPLLAHFVENRKLSKKEIEELKRLLDKKP